MSQRSKFNPFEWEKQANLSERNPTSSALFLPRVQYESHFDVHRWYQSLSSSTMPTAFVKVSVEEARAMCAVYSDEVLCELEKAPTEDQHRLLDALVKRIEEAMVSVAAVNYRSSARRSKGGRVVIDRGKQAQKKSNPPTAAAPEEQQKSGFHPVDVTRARRAARKGPRTREDQSSLSPSDAAVLSTSPLKIASDSPLSPPPSGRKQRPSRRELPSLQDVEADEGEAPSFFVRMSSRACRDACLDSNHPWFRDTYREELGRVRKQNSEYLSSVLRSEENFHQTAPADNAATSTTATAVAAVGSVASLSSSAASSPSRSPSNEDASHGSPSSSSSTVTAASCNGDPISDISISNDSRTETAAASVEKSLSANNSSNNNSGSSNSRKPVTLEDNDLHALALIRTASSLMRIETGQQALWLLTHSKRVFADILRSLHCCEIDASDWDVNICVRSWAELDPLLEMRGVVFGGELTALTQYSHLYCVPWMDVEKSASLCIDFFESRIRGRIPGASLDCVVDFAINSDQTRAWLIELNPFGMIGNAGLLDWKSNRRQLQRGEDAWGDLDSWEETFPPKIIGDGVGREVSSMIIRGVPLLYMRYPLAGMSTKIIRAVGVEFSKDKSCTDVDLVHHDENVSFATAGDLGKNQTDSSATSNAGCMIS